MKFYFCGYIHRAFWQTSSRNHNRFGNCKSKHLQLLLMLEGNPSHLQVYTIFNLSKRFIKEWFFISLKEMIVPIPINPAIFEASWSWRPRESINCTEPWEWPTYISFCFLEISKTPLIIAGWSCSIKWSKLKSQNASSSTSSFCDIIFPLLFPSHTSYPYSAKM